MFWSKVPEWVCCLFQQGPEVTPVDTVPYKDGLAYSSMYLPRAGARRCVLVFLRSCFLTGLVCSSQDSCVRFLSRWGRMAVPPTIPATVSSAAMRIPVLLSMLWLS